MQNEQRERRAVPQGSAKPGAIVNDLEKIDKSLQLMSYLFIDK